MGVEPPPNGGPAATAAPDATSRDADADADEKLSDRPAWQITTLVVAIIGALTGISGLILSLDNRQEQRAISLDATATISAADTDHGLYALQLSLANGGVRGVVIKRAALWLHDRRVAWATGYLPDFESIAAYFVPGADLPHPRPLPFPLAERQSLVLGLILDPHPGARLSQLLLRNQKKMARTLGLRESMKLDGATLRLDLVPGGVKEFPVEQRVADSLDRTAIDYFEFEIRAPPNRNAAIHLSVSYPEVFAGETVELSVWDKAKREPLFRVERPLSAFIRFPLGISLRPGQYEAAFSINERIVFSGAFRAPCMRLIPSVNRPPPPAWSDCGRLLWRRPEIRIPLAG